MQEENVESYLKKYVKIKGGLCLKLIPVSMRGLPDRIVLLPKGKLFFAELKAPKQKPLPPTAGTTPNFVNSILQRGGGLVNGYSEYNA